MKDIVNFFDGLPWIVKIILALPMIDGIAWGIYRIAKGLDKKDTVMVIAGVVWIVAGFFILWVIDLFTIITQKKPTVLA